MSAAEQKKMNRRELQQLLSRQDMSVAAMKSRTGELCSRSEGLVRRMEDLQISIEEMTTAKEALQQELRTKQETAERQAVKLELRRVQKEQLEEILSHTRDTRLIDVAASGDLSEITARLEEILSNAQKEADELLGILRPHVPEEAPEEQTDRSLEEILQLLPPPELPDFLLNDPEAEEEDEEDERCPSYEELVKEFLQKDTGRDLYRSRRKRTRHSLLRGDR